jgi:hypothetical protein
MSVWIELTPFEIYFAGLIGAARNDQATRNAWKETSGQADGDKFHHNIEGACAEIAVCKWRKIYWDPNVGDIKAPDAGPYQVRCNGSRRRDDMNLRPHPSKDVLKKNYIWISVCSFSPKYRIDGWIWGDTAMPEQTTCTWFREGAVGRGKSWWVPREMLHALEKLPSPEETLRLMQQRNALVLT